MIESTIAFVLANYIIFLMYYIPAGIIYTFIKWTLSLVKLRRKILSLPDNGTESQRNYATRYIFSDSSSYPPKASDNVSLIVIWAMFWPINLVWTLFADVLTEVWNFIVSKTTVVYQAIATAILPK